MEQCSKAWTLESDVFAFESQLYHFFAVWCWVLYLTSLGFSLLLFENEDNYSN